MIRVRTGISAVTLLTLGVFISAGSLLSMSELADWIHFGWEGG